MADGGYERPELWLSDGFDAVRAGGWRAPLYWERDDGGWQLFTLSGMQPVSLADPVCHVSAYEADAFAHWAHARLSGEDEWEILAASFVVEGNFVESGLLHPASPAVTATYPDSFSATPGNGHAAPTDRIPVIGRLRVRSVSTTASSWPTSGSLRGGSCATPQTHLRASYRNFFPPSARWQFSGVRMARDLR